RDRVSVVERALADGDRRVRIPYDEVGVVPHTNVAFAVVEAREPSRRTAHPFDDMPRTGVPDPRSFPHRRKPELKGRDATPSGEEVVVGCMRMLERGRAGRMIGDDHVNVADKERAPQRLTMLGASNRRRALELRRAVRYLLGGE